MHAHKGHEEHFPNNSLQSTNAVVLNAVRRRKSANERKRKSAKGRKRAPKSKKMQTTRFETTRFGNSQTHPNQNKGFQMHLRLEHALVFLNFRSFPCPLCEYPVLDLPRCGIRNTDPFFLKVLMRVRGVAMQPRLRQAPLPRCTCAFWLPPVSEWMEKGTKQV